MGSITQIRDSMSILQKSEKELSCYTIIFLSVYMKQVLVAENLSSNGTFYYIMQLFSVLSFFFKKTNSLIFT